MTQESLLFFKLGILGWVLLFNEFFLFFMLFSSLFFDVCEVVIALLKDSISNFTIYILMQIVLASV